MKRKSCGTHHRSKMELIMMLSADTVKRGQDLLLTLEQKWILATTQWQLVLFTFIVFICFTHFAAFQDMGLTLRIAAECYGVPFGTLCKKASDAKVGGDRKPELSYKDEEDLAQYLRVCVLRGEGLTQNETIQLVTEFVCQEKIETRWKNGEDWFHGFLARHPELRIRKDEENMISENEHDLYPKLLESDDDEDDNWESYERENDDAEQTGEEEVMTLERILLQTIKFDLQVEHPYSYLLKYAKCLKGDKAKLQKMVQMAWTFVNDSLCTTLSLQWEPEVIAVALMYLAGKLSKFEVVDWMGRVGKHLRWWDMFVEDVTMDLLEDICHQVLDLYSQPQVAANAPDSPPLQPSIHSPTSKKERLPRPISPAQQQTLSPLPSAIPVKVTKSEPKSHHTSSNGEGSIDKMEIPVIGKQPDISLPYQYPSYNHSALPPTYSTPIPTSLYSHQHQYLPHSQYGSSAPRPYYPGST
uniref:(California timema) hypothetical protein n=1 Tax=Timema californicum TaxID=61474 RepID=A0A7R9P816_TIMCA|nr:unnamed protein product [Timema californicum]